MRTVFHSRNDTITELILNFSTSDILDTADTIKVVPKQTEKVEYECKKSQLGLAIKKTQTEQNLVSRNPSRDLYFISKQDLILGLK